MSQTQRERITDAAVPLQRSHGVVAVSQKYNIKILKKNNKKTPQKLGDGYVILCLLAE